MSQQRLTHILNQKSTAQQLANRFTHLHKSQWRTSLYAAFVTLVFHSVLFLLLSNNELVLKYTDYNESENVVEVTLEMFEAERFVEANPEAPKNEPDRTNNYSFRAQQSADQNPAESLMNLPNVEGEDASQKIVQGSASSATALLESGVYALSGTSTADSDENNRANRASPSAALVQVPAFIQQEPLVEEGPGSNPEVIHMDTPLSQMPEFETPLELYRPDPTWQDDPALDISAEDAPAVRPLPRERPTLRPDLIHGPLMRYEGSASRCGTLAIDTTFSQFGDYQQQFYAAVQAGWYQEISFYQPMDTAANVRVQFRIHSDGTIDEVKVLHSTAGEIATLICQLALTKRSPFRPWTAEMIQTFGHKRVMEVVFSYR